MASTHFSFNRLRRALYFAVVALSVALCVIPGHNAYAISLGGVFGSDRQKPNAEAIDKVTQQAGRVASDAETAAGKLADETTKAISDRIASGISDRISKDITSRMTRDLTRLLPKGLGSNPSKAALDKASKAISRSISTGLKGSIPKDVAKLIPSNLAAGLSKGQIDQIASRVTDNLKDKIGGELQQKLGGALSSDLKDRLGGALSDGVVKDLSEGITKNLSGDLAKGLSENITKGLGDAIGMKAAGGSYGLGPDNRYLEEEFICTEGNVAGSCSTDPISHYTTPLLSPIADMNPYLYTGIMNPDDPLIPFVGELNGTPVYRGTAGDGRFTNRIVFCPPGEDAERSSRCYSGGVNQITALRENDPDPVLVRMQLDNVANQFILKRWLFPEQADFRLYAGGETPEENNRLALEKFCQPFRIVAPPDEEYIVSDYLRGAWKKLLEDPSHRIRPDIGKSCAETEEGETAGGGACEPAYDSDVVLDPPIPFGEMKIKGETESPQPATIRLGDLAASQYEEVVDPSHPFSPRWDYEYNERDKYSPETASYSEDPANAVRCAGDKDQKIIKVDVLNIGQPKSRKEEFDERITQRIAWNNACKADSLTGTANGKSYTFINTSKPCCLIVSLTPYKCKPQPCTTCFGMTAEKPGCSTVYDQTYDRLRMRIPPFVPNINVPGVDMAQMANVQGLMSGGGMLGAGGPLSGISGISGLGKIGDMAGKLGGGLGGLGNAIGGGLGGLGNAISGGLSGAMKGLEGAMGSIGKFTNSLGFDKLTGALGKFNLGGLNLGKLDIGSLGDVMDKVGDIRKVVDAVKDGDWAKLAGMGLKHVDLEKFAGVMKIDAFDKVANFAKMGMEKFNVGELKNLAKLDIEKVIKAASKGDAEALIKMGLKEVDLSKMGALARIKNPKELEAALKGVDFKSIGDDVQLTSKTVKEVGEITKEVNLDKFNELAKSPDIKEMLAKGQGAMHGFTLDDLTKLKNKDTFEALKQFASSDPVKKMLSDANPFGKALDGKLTASDLGAFSNIEGQANNLKHIQDLTKSPAFQELSKLAKASNLSIGDLKALSNGDATKAISSLIQSKEIQKILNVPGMENLRLGDIRAFANADPIGIAKALGKLDVVKNFDFSKFSLGDKIDFGKLKDLGLGNFDVKGLEKLMKNVDFGELAKIAKTGDLTKLAGMGLDKLDIPGLNAIKTIGIDKIANVLQNPSLQSISNLSPELAKLGVPGAEALGQAGALLAMANSEIKMGFLKATCGKPHIEKTCSDLSKPFTMMNKLKVRATEDLEEGTPEGLTFEEYFGNRRPYLRWHDTGAEHGSEGGKPDMMSDEGAKVAIVGVGREGERCLYGGGGGEGSGDISVPKPDPITSWAELKLYQARSQRLFGMSCLARYEQAYKFAGTEDTTLGRAGATFDRVTANNEGDLAQLRSMAIPLAYRGYIANPDEDKRFPNFGGAAGLYSNLDDVRVGDIVLFPEGRATTAGVDGSGASEADKPGLPSVGYVSRISSRDDRVESIEILEANTGRYPDVCGITDGLGLPLPVTIYRDQLPEEIAAALEELGAETSGCEDPMLSACVLGEEKWTSTEFYRPTEDVRTEGGDGGPI